MTLRLGSGNVHPVSTVSGRLTMEKALLRAAGEHAVVSELSRRGALAALVTEGARGVDILASKDQVRVSIQVKTKRPEVNQWLLPTFVCFRSNERARIGRGPP